MKKLIRYILVLTMVILALSMVPAAYYWTYDCSGWSPEARAGIVFFSLGVSAAITLIKDSIDEI